VNGADAVDMSLRLGAVAIGGAGDKLRGALEASRHVTPEVGVVPHPRKRARMQHLHQEGGDPADHHAREVAVHLPAGAVRAEEAGILPATLDGVVARAADQFANLVNDGLSDRRGTERLRL
jgi:hypothetical protein